MFAFLIFDCTFAHLLATKHKPRSSVKEKFDFLAYALIFVGSVAGRVKASFLTLIARSKFNPHPGHVVASLDKAVYDDYLCMVASNKEQIQWAIIQKNSQEHWKLLSRCRFVPARTKCGFVQARTKRGFVQASNAVQ